MAMPWLGPTTELVAFEEQTHALDFRHLVLVMQRGVGARFFKMLLVVDRRRDDLAGIGDRAEERAFAERDCLCRAGRGGDRRAQLG